MRLDLYLKLCRLAKSRNIAQKLCDDGLVKVGGLKAKAAKEVRGGEIIEVAWPSGNLTQIRVLSIPDRNQVSRAESRTLYSVIEG